MELARNGALVGLLTCCSFAAAQTSGWTNLQPLNSPPWRATEGLAFESFSGLVVMYGGGGTTGLLGDTWILAGNNWLQQSPTTSPGLRTNLQMAQSPTPLRVVLFGGATGPGVADATTWEFDVATMDWSNVTPAGPSPAARQHACLVHDSLRNRAVLFGGTNGSSSAFFGDTWEWDGTAWTSFAPATSPPGRAWHSMAYDSTRGRTVLFGGYNGSQLGDTWEWDGTSWTQVSTAAAPAAQSSGAMAYDATSRRVVLFGGSYGWPNGLDDTWHYDGANWYLTTPTGPVPPQQYLHRMIGCPPLGGVLVYGAYGNGWSNLNDTWLYAAPGVAASFTSFGAGCAGSAGVPVLAAAAGQLPWIGTTFTVDFTNLPSPAPGPVFACVGLSRTAWGAFTLPYPLAGFGMPGCFALVDPAVAVLRPNYGGSSNFSFVIPSSLPFEGVQLFVQGVVFDTGVNAANLTVTNGGEATIGSR